MKMTKTRKKILCTTIVVLIVAFFIGFNHLFIIDMRKEIVPVNETTINSDGQVQVTLTYGGYCNRHLKFRSSFFNIVKAAETLDGLVVAPGEAFSWFEFMGPCDGSQGYKPGIGFGAYMPNLTYGGGVCLCSTLIYKAESACGMTTIERHDHSEKVSYANPGEDAAVNFADKDFRFVNSTEYTATFHVTCNRDDYSVTCIVVLS